MASQQPSSSSNKNQRPSTALHTGHGVPTSSTDNHNVQAENSAPKKKKKKNHRKRGKAKGDRRQSFAIPEGDAHLPEAESGQEVATHHHTSTRSFYKLGHATGGNLSETSLESEALLDHRDHPPLRTRRDSRAAFPGPDLSQSFHQSVTTPRGGTGPYRPRSQTVGKHRDVDDADARAPLLGPKQSQHSPTMTFSYGLFGGADVVKGSPRTRSRGSSRSREALSYDVNNPPSVPSTPKVGSDAGLDDVMITEHLTTSGIEGRRKSEPAPGEQIIDIDGDATDDPYQHSTPQTPRGEGVFQRRHPLANSARDDVCFPHEGMSEIAEEDYVGDAPVSYRQRRRRAREWPDLTILQEWSREEKEEWSEGIRAKKINEPVLVEGRLRPSKQRWHRAEEDAPYRFTYFNEEFQSTVHSQTISELVQPGQTFRDLFIPDPPELSDESSDDDEVSSHFTQENRSQLSPTGGSRAGTRHSSIIGAERNGPAGDSSGRGPQTGNLQPAMPALKPNEKPKRYGNRPVFWLDVLSPTEAEMRVIAKAFGIHPLTAEDILMQEPREKVELFHNYYFVNYRTFEQDVNSEDYLDPVNMYVVVFREGVLSFHFSMTPHPANVRRRIRQLKDYLILSADWISYAIIDDITDTFAPLIQAIEDEVDKIDDAILQLHNNPGQDTNKPGKSDRDAEKQSTSSSETTFEYENGGDMLRKVGQVRKKVMLLYRLLGSKADVIKGFAKRCNEQWNVAPRSEIGLYLGDIQDHLLTMSSSLGHYENLLSRAHSNYLAQINISMNERQELTADVLGKLTVLGTIVLPMNVVTGLFGANFRVLGDQDDSLYWFWGTTAALVGYAVVAYYVCRKAYGII